MRNWTVSACAQSGGNEVGPKISTPYSTIGLLIVSKNASQKRCPENAYGSIVGQAWRETYNPF